MSWIQLNNTAGANSRAAKLTEQQARQICREYAAGKRGKTEAARYGITPSHYNRIGRRAAWRCLGELK